MEFNTLRQNARRIIARTWILLVMFLVMGGMIFAQSDPLPIPEIPSDFRGIPNTQPQQQAESLQQFEVPVGLRLMTPEVSANDVLFRWFPLPDVRWYKLRIQKIGSDGLWLDEKVTNLNICQRATGCSISLSQFGKTLNPNKQYRWKIIAKTSDGERVKTEWQRLGTMNNTRDLVTGIFDIADGDVPALLGAVDAINNECTLGKNYIINLAESGLYTLTAPDPASTNNSANPIDSGLFIACGMTINGNGSTLTRNSSVAEFRVIEIQLPSTISNRSVTLNNLSVTNGQIGGSSTTVGGAGILANGGNFYLESVNITDNTNNITSNAKGGGMYIRGSSTSDTFVISNSVIANNYAFHRGGGIYFIGSSSGNVTQGTITNSTFNNNIAYFEGGAIYSHYYPKPSDINITSTLFESNQIDRSSISGISNGGTAIWADSNVDIQQSCFTDNYGIARYDVSVTHIENNWWGPTGYSIDPNDINTHEVVTNAPSSVLTSQPDCGAPSSDICVETTTFTRSVSCQIPTTEEQLNTYGIVATGWTENELVNILAGVKKIAEAVINASTQSYNTPQAAFRAIMFLDPDPIHTIQVSKTPKDGASTCHTTKVPAGTVRATIECEEGIDMDEQLIVHELGHVFLHQTANATPVDTSNGYPCTYNSADPDANDVAFINCIEDPKPAKGGNPTDVALRGLSVDSFVFGVIGRIKNKNEIATIIQEFDPESAVYGVYVTNFSFTQCETPSLFDVSTNLCSDNSLPTGNFQDWERGQRGWDSVNFGNSAGPCSEMGNDTFNVSVYQKNPCNIVKWIIEESNAITEDDAQILGVLELEEAGADMFLNWVYRMITNPDLNAFGDNKGDSTGDYPESLGAGDDRRFWMNDIMRSFFEYYGW